MVTILASSSSPTTPSGILVEAASVVIESIVVELAWFFLGRWERFLEVLVLEMHALLHVEQLFDRRFQIGDQGGICRRPVPDRNRVATELRRENQAEYFATGNT